jgi:hypothetical protein
MVADRGKATQPRRNHFSAYLPPGPRCRQRDIKTPLASAHVRVHFRSGVPGQLARPSVATHRPRRRPAPLCDLVREAVLETRRQVLDPTLQAHPSLHRPIFLDDGTSTPRCLTVQSARANDSIRSANTPIDRHAGCFTLLRGSRPRGSKRLLSPGSVRPRAELDST